MVTFINTKGMAFFGPGSEWFWAALQFTALLITFIAIYRQLRTARSSQAVDQVLKYTQLFDDERMVRQQLAILVAVRDNLEIPKGAGVSVANYFEGLGSLSRGGHLDVHLLWRVSGLIAQRWWTVLKPFVQRERVVAGDGVFSDFEWLARALTQLDRRAGGTLTIDAAYVANWLGAGAIEGLQDNLRIDQSLRSFIIAPPDGLDTAQAVATAPAPNPPAKPADDTEPDHSV